MQWAAVRTQLLATRVPPQVWYHFAKDWYCRETWGRGEHRHMGGRALEEGKVGRALPSDPSHQDKSFFSQQTGYIGT